VLVFKFFGDDLDSCVIVHDGQNNVSDHLPLSTTVTVPQKNYGYVPDQRTDLPQHPWINWSLIAVAAQDLKPISIHSLDNLDQAKSAVNSVCDQLNSVFHNTCIEKQSKY